MIRAQQEKIKTNYTRHILIIVSDQITIPAEPGPPTAPGPGHLEITVTHINNYKIYNLFCILYLDKNLFLKFTVSLKNICTVVKLFINIMLYTFTEV